MAVQTTKRAVWARLIEATPDAVLAVDAAGRIALANPAAHALFGYDAGGLAGRPVELLVPERFRLVHQLHRARYVARPAPAQLSLYGRRADGSEFPLDLSIGPFPGGGGPWTVIVARDGAERTLLLAVEQSARRRAEALAAERAAVLAHVADAVVLVDPSGVPSYLNPAAARLFGLASPDGWLVGVAFGTPGVPAGGLGELPATRSALAGGHLAEAEVMVTRPDGSAVEAVVSASPVTDDGGATLGAVLTIRDVTAQRTFERRRDELFANVSHDLRTPVAVIQASLGVVIANAPPETPPALKRLLANADLAAGRLAALVQDLLELGRLRAGRGHLRLSPCDLVALARRAARTVEPLTQQRAQRLELALPARPVPAVVDVDRIERALLNLLSNATKHGRDGGLIRLSLEPRDGGVEIAVADDGPGVPAEEQERVFERFYVVGADEARPGGGGLGLPIARALVELHGGQLTLESTPGAGAVFRIRLPLDRAHEHFEQEVAR